MLIQMKHSFPVSSHYRLIINLVKKRAKSKSNLRKIFLYRRCVTWTIFCNRRSDEKVTTVIVGALTTYFVSVIVYIITGGTFADRKGIFIILVLLYF